MVKNQTCVINRCCKSHKERIGAYRLLDNDSWGVGDVVGTMASVCSENAKGRSHVLCIEDTSELNYDNISGRLRSDDPDFGPGTEESMSYSIFVHPCLVVDECSLTPLGFSHVDIWSRARDRSRIPDRHVRPLEEKESYKWAKGAEKSVASLPPEVPKTVVCDREGDTYETMARIKACGCDFLIRSHFNRHSSDGHPIWGKMLESEPACTYEMVVKRKGEATRTALMELRWERFDVKCPRRGSGGYPKTTAVTCVYTREVPGTAPKGTEPVEWKLLTSHEVGGIEDAMRIVRWYRLRWMIEEVFAVIKSRGMDVGDAQLESGKAMKKLVILSLYAAWAIMVAKTALDAKSEDMPASIIFSERQILTLNAIMGYLHAQSPRAKDGKNPYLKQSMPWAAWILARLGGWSGYEKAHGRPGYKTLSKGLDKFYTWHLARTSCDPQQKDVYKD